MSYFVQIFSLNYSKKVVLAMVLYGNINLLPLNIFLGFFFKPSSL